MPFKSKAQAGYMWINHPALAKEFAEKTVNMKSLPEHVKKQKQKEIKKMMNPKG